MQEENEDSRDDGYDSNVPAQWQLARQFLRVQRNHATAGEVELAVLVAQGHLQSVLPARTAAARIELVDDAAAFRGHGRDSGVKTRPRQRNEGQQHVAHGQRGLCPRPGVVPKQKPQAAVGQDHVDDEQVCVKCGDFIGVLLAVCLDDGGARHERHHDQHGEPTTVRGDEERVRVIWQQARDKQLM